MINNIFIRTGYSISQSIIKLDAVIEFAKINNLKKIGIIDKDYMHAAYEFIILANKNNLSPIVGVEFSKVNIIVIAINHSGYNDLISLSSKYHLDFDSFKKDLMNYQNNLANNLFIVQNDNFQFASFVKKGDIETFKYFKKITDSNINLYNEISLDSELENNYQIEILNQINNLNFDLNLKPIPFNENINFFNNEENQILENKTKIQLQNLNLEPEKLKIYENRLEYELSIIKKMNFASYFLIVEDYVDFSNKNDIFMGPGRGSAPGSLIAYLLGITKIDPIINNLLFERFLNPSRTTIPDIDIDFHDDKRHDVSKYLISKYGPNNTAQIITFQTFQTKNSIKDIARIFGVDFKLVNEFTKLINEQISLSNNLKNKKIMQFFQNHPEFESIVKHAIIIIGIPRQISTHAAGILISNYPIYQSVPTMINPSNEQTLSQYSMNFLEDNGLIKFDILGLKNLSVIKNIFNIIKITQNKDLKMVYDNFNDIDVFKLLSDSKTQGIFQLESSGMKNAIKKIGIDSFEDVVSVISLFRPGPIKNIDLFSQRKNNSNSSIYYSIPILDDILKATYGIIIYQEQILEIANKFSNLTLYEADNLRRAMSKKDDQKIKDLRDVFISGALNNGYEIKVANNVFDLIYEFSNYGFNRSHAFAYAIITYNFALLKTKYPIEFSAAYLASIENEPTKIQMYLDENNNITLLKPSLRSSFGKISLEKKGIRIGFNSIKGIGPEIINKIINSKNEIIDSDNIYVILMILFKNGVSIKILEILVKVGIFDEYKYTRESLLSILDKIPNLTKLTLTKDNKIIFNILSLDDYPVIVEIPDLKNSLYEKTFLGFEI